MEDLIEIPGFNERAALNVETETWTWLACPISMC